MLNDCGNALCNLGRFDEAEKSLRRALQLKPDFARAHFNLGNVLHNLRRATQALASYRTALRLRPDMSAVHFGLRNALLITGQFEEGWKEWKEEWHWRMKDKAPPFPEPLWNGEAIGDRVILLPAFEGYGDTISVLPLCPTDHRQKGHPRGSTGPGEITVPAAWCKRGCFRRPAAFLRSVVPDDKPAGCFRHDVGYHPGDNALSHCRSFGSCPLA